MKIVVDIITIAIMASVYFLPTIVAWYRHRQPVAIFLVNLCFGWTGVGWLVALVMALWGVGNRRQAPA